MSLFKRYVDLAASRGELIEVSIEAVFEPMVQVRREIENWRKRLVFLSSKMHPDIVASSENFRKIDTSLFQKKKESLYSAFYSSPSAIHSFPAEGCIPISLAPFNIVAGCIWRLDFLHRGNFKRRYFFEVVVVYREMRKFVWAIH